MPNVASNVHNTKHCKRSQDGPGDGHPNTWIGHGVEREKRGEMEFVLSLPISGMMVCGAVEGSISKQGKRERGKEFLLFYAKSPKDREESEQ